MAFENETFISISINFIKSRFPTLVGKIMIVQMFPNGNPNQNHLYYADLENIGNIKGKIHLKPVYTADLNTESNVSISSTRSKKKNQIMHRFFSW